MNDERRVKGPHSNVLKNKLFSRWTQRQLTFHVRFSIESTLAGQEHPPTETSRPLSLGPHPVWSFAKFLGRPSLATPLIGFHVFFVLGPILQNCRHHETHNLSHHRHRPTCSWPTVGPAREGMRFFLGGTNVFFWIQKTTVFLGYKSLFFGIQNAFSRDTKKSFLTFSEVKRVSSIVHCS